MHTTAFAGAFLACGLAVGLDAQRPVLTARELDTRKTHKLGESWLKNANWTLSFADAKTRAAKEGKLIFAYFTRSYAP